jgi:carbon starvation protein
MNSLYLVFIAVACYYIAYRFHARFIAMKVWGIDANRVTPAHQFNDGIDYVPTHKGVLFGHHFAAIAGAGPLIGPILAAQMGYLPGAIWIIAGVILAGAVQDMLILLASTRRQGKSLGEMIRMELGQRAGMVCMIGILLIMVILLAVLALVVVKALADSPWGTFTLLTTLPIALLMGLYLRFVGEGKIALVSVVGFILLLLSIWLGGQVASSSYAEYFTFSAKTIAFGLIGYGFAASSLPVWLMLAPRDYLSTFLKIGTIVGLAFAILWVGPELKMPSVTQFIDGTGPVFKGSVFPFLFVTLACGAISGFHALVASGTTPKMMNCESDAPLIGYGSMICESFVAIMALIAACTLEPGLYFAMNSPAAVLGTTAESAATVISNWGFSIDANTLIQTAKETGETTIISRVGGAPTLAVGMAQILSSAFGKTDGMMAFWYHFAILFEALFILTTVDAGTRVARFLIQDFLGYFNPKLSQTNYLWGNLLGTGLAVGGWGYFLYQGVIDPLGGINSLWPLFGIANQMLAGIALLLITTILCKMKKQKYAFVPGLPAIFVMIITFTAGFEKIFNNNPKIGFLAQITDLKNALEEHRLIAPAKNVEQMMQIIQSTTVNIVLTSIFMTVLATMLFFTIREIYKSLQSDIPTSCEDEPCLTGFESAENQHPNAML